MFQVTALYADAEIAYAEGDDYQDTVRECVAGIPEMYLACPEDVKLSAFNPTHTVSHVVTPLDIWQMFS